MVSIQSTARPGCIIELEQLADSAGSGWSKADLFHIYQEGFILTSSNNNNNNNNANEIGAGGTRLNAHFNETYFLVLLEKKVHNMIIIHILNGTFFVD